MFTPQLTTDFILCCPLDFTVLLGDRRTSFLFRLSSSHVCQRVRPPPPQSHDTLYSSSLPTLLISCSPDTSRASSSYLSVFLPTFLLLLSLPLSFWIKHCHCCPKVGQHISSQRYHFALALLFLLASWRTTCGSSCSQLWQTNKLNNNHSTFASESQTTDSTLSSLYFLPRFNALKHQSVSRPLTFSTNIWLTFRRPAKRNLSASRLKSGVRSRLIHCLLRLCHTPLKSFSINAICNMLLAQDVTEGLS